ncbi:hypothetical protein NDU88_007423 [Pleurodeles waltl]|uniref:Uncharacterized protein n=1 Tax=Pleurodeles waltl TaxID=8319 RepID=A0AAV7LUU0_PLEWA|nr:hypothetical protein NDU88_007423 [Pleurodeles waltl]
MRPGETAILPVGQSNHCSPPGARSAARQLRQLAPGLAPLRLPTECVFRRVTRSQTASPPQLAVSAGVLHYLQPPGLLNPPPCPWPQPRTRACPCVLLRPPASSGTVSVCLSSVRSFLGPTGSSAATGEPGRHLPLLYAVLTLTAMVRGTMQGLRAASNCSPVHGRDPGPGPAPCVLLGPPASSDTASVRLSRAQSPLDPQAPAGTSAATGEPARCLPLLCAVRALSTSIRGTTQGRGLCRVLRPTDSEVPDGQIPALPELPRRPTHGPLRWACPAAWTSIGPGRAHYRLSIRRPLRS